MLVVLVAAAAASWHATTHERHALPRLQRTCRPQCGAVAVLCRQRFGCSEAAAQHTEAKLKHRAEYIDATMANEKCDALQARLGLSEAQLQKVVVTQPAVLGLSFESNVEPSLAKLQARLGLSEAQLQKVVVTQPPVLGFSFESNVEPSLAKLQARLGLSEAQLQKVVVTLPAVLSYSFESNLEPKLGFLQAELVLSVDVLREKVLRLPASLGYSLERRYRPRLAACHMAGVDVTLVMDRVAMTDKRFYASIGLGPEE